MGQKMAKFDQRGIMLLPMVIIIAVAMSTSVLVVPTIADIANVNPDSPFYPLERLGEDIRGISANDRMMERAEEYLEMAASGKAEQYSIILQDFQNDMAAATVEPAQQAELVPIVTSITTTAGNENITLRGTGVLFAHGTGSAELAGDALIIRVSTKVGGTAVVSEKATVKAHGDGNVENLENGFIQYTGHGMLKITGDNITVSISGENIVLIAAGQGYATLSGHGKYRAIGVRTGEWTIQTG